ncbi:MAG: filamentous hemagglutinin N-terminal domain-containing protein, partial [Bdellovibrionales bacterium]|nr:filamentous hemagglutinin N-terminal domain-containing protein [Ramlibacter sp.]
MNANLFRIVFNKARGLLMAVAETAAGQGKGQGDGRAPGHAIGQYPHDMRMGRALANMTYTATAAIIAVAIIALFTSAEAQIIADPSAPGTQRAIVLKAPNGVPLVNIQTPSAAGISRNVFGQFDVQRNGAILNNSRTNVQTQLGGWAQGNPWLATGAAKVILNEVNSANPSLLKGYVEVAGQKADVIIANPAGIKVDGAGFINAGNVVLTTGTPLFNSSGSLDSFRVQRGSVVIEGLGLDTRNASFTDIIARSVQVNAGLWAIYLRVAGGAGDVYAADPTRITGLADSLATIGDKPLFMLDVAALGGMYANHIYLVGSEAGLGVNNSGAITASGAGAGSELVLLANGQLVNRGTLQATGELQINSTGGISNGGTLYAGGGASLSTQGNISNTSLIAAQGNVTLQAGGAGSQINSKAGATILAGVNADGSVGGAGSLTISTGGAAFLNGQTSAGTVSISASTLSTDGGSLSGGHLTLAAQALSNQGGEIVQTGPGALAINLPGELHNAGGRIASAGNVLLSAVSLSNNSGQIAAGSSITVTTDTLTNTQGSF